MAQSDATIYDVAARAPLYRMVDQWVITVSGYNNDGDFVYRIVRLPLNTTPTKLGELAIETLKGYRRFDENESQRLIDAFNETTSPEEFENLGVTADAGIYREGKVLHVEAGWKKDVVYKSKLPLSASPASIGAALLEGYSKLDQKYPGLRDAERAVVAKRKRRRK
jgi:hypothetical protein